MSNKIGTYTTHEFLGSGAFGSVIKASKNGSDKWYAIKRISKQSILRTSMAGQVKKEITIMKTLDHPNIVRTEEVLMSSKYVFICMEHVTGGELSTRVTSSGRLSDKLSSRFTRQICEAMDFCHSRKICHRDIKPQNILIDGRDNVKIVDFGFASFMETDAEETEEASFRVDNIHDLRTMEVPPDEFSLDLNQSSANVTRLKKMRTYCGTVQYMAPEISSGNYFGDKVDMWAIGMVVHFMLMGCLPVISTTEVYTRGRPPRFVERLSRSVSKGAWDVMRNLLVRESERYSAAKILTKSWLHLDNCVDGVEDVDRSVTLSSRSDEEQEEDDDDSDSTSEFTVVVASDFETNGKELIDYIGSVLKDHENTCNVLIRDDQVKVSINTSTGVAYLLVTLQHEGGTVAIHVEKVRGECSTRRMMEVKMALDHMK